MANNQYNFLDYAGLSLFWNNVKSIIEENELTTTSALTNLDTRVGNVEASKSDKGHQHEKITHTLWSYYDAIPDTTSPADICARFGVSTTSVNAVFTGMVQAPDGTRNQSLFWTDYGAAGLVELTKSYGGDTRLKYRVSTGWEDVGANWSTAGYRELANVEDLTWANIKSKPETATRWPSWSEITSKPTTISGYGITDALTTSNYTSYTVKKDGTGASGTWGINITGNATYSNFFVGCKNTITVAGDADTYYPVVISATANKKSPNIITIWKDLGSTTAPYPENHDNGSSSMLYRYDIRNNFWDGNGGYCTTLDARYMYARLVSETTMLGMGVGNFCIWLRGGGTEYNINTSWYISSADINVYYSSTNVGTNTYPVTIAPRTDIGNEGVFNTMTIPCNVRGAATASWATNAGSAPASDVYSWAKQSTKPSYTGSEVTLTGYSKASSYSEISASDTVNQAIAKLEGALSGLEVLLASI